MEEQNDLQKKRHSLAHLLAAAVLELFPDALPTLGPAIDNGFYYDFKFKKNISDKDLETIETKMREIMPTWESFTGREVDEKEARETYKNNPFKLELVEEIIDKKEPITFYTSGSFVDLCRGGHIDNMKDIDPACFILDRIAGAYWRGDEKNEMLTRIYGLAFDTKEELEKYLEQRAEAEKRDHRKLGKELDLFTFSDLVGPGLPLFTPKGALMRNLIVEKIDSIQNKFGYQKVSIPHITKKDLYETSGHWDKFKEDLFHVKGVSDTEFVMKPMNCPHHTQIFDSQTRSYRDLPIRYTETTAVYRDEQAGELLGLSRVRSITQDDGHVFCTLDQVEEEVGNIVKVIKEFYTNLELFREGNYWVSLSVRDSEKMDKYLGDDTHWSQAESMLDSVARAEDLNYRRVEGEAAFYGPKLDFMFKDSMGREWQLATAQLDFVMPERFGLKYTDKDGTEKTPVMIHRAIAGSLERFMSVIIEHFGGAFPLWLSPVQLVVLPISEKHEDYARQIDEKIKEAGFRSELESDGESLGKRIRQAKMKKVPYLVVVGDQEKESGTLTLESRDEETSDKMSVEELISKLKEEIGL